MHCLDCGDESHPRFRHPSSLRTEATLWAVALVVGLVVGAWQILTVSRGDSSPAVMSGLSTAAPAAEASAPLTHSLTRDAPRNVALEAGNWLVRQLTEFLKTAWWALPIPLAFSLWRQRNRRPVCAHCGSRKLIPADPVVPALSD